MFHTFFLKPYDAHTIVFLLIQPTAAHFPLRQSGAPVLSCPQATTSSSYSSSFIFNPLLPLLTLQFHTLFLKPCDAHTIVLYFIQLVAALFPKGKQAHQY